MKLLTRFLRSYVIFSALLLTLSTPVFYYVVNYLFLEEIEEELHEHVADFVNATPHIKSDFDLEQYSNFNKEISVHKVKILPPRDSLFTVEQYDSLEGEMVPFRILRSGLIFNNTPYAIEIRESLFENKDIIEAIVGAQILLFALLLLGLVVINRGLSRKIWGPFYRMLRELKSYDIRSGKSFSAEDPNVTEFIDLKRELVSLIERSIRSYQSQKEFTENAAHEMQTPVAVCLSKIEVLMQSRELNEEQAMLIEELYEAAKRLSRLNRDLLMLARIDNHQFLEIENVSVTKLIEQYLAQYRELLKERGIVVDLDRKSELELNANPAMLEILINNLLSNAAKYSPTDGLVKVVIEKDSIEIRNDGQPLKNEKLIFQRFQRDKNSTSGSGLGLAIAKSICERSGFKIAYWYSDNAHHFLVKFR